MHRREFLRGLVVLPVAGLLLAASVSEKEDEEECEDLVDELIIPPGQSSYSYRWRVSPSNANGTTWTSTSTQGNTSARVQWGV